MEIILSNRFTADVNYYRKKKKYTKITADIDPILSELETGNLIGDRLENLPLAEGTAAYKVRVANSSTGVGKSNGFRVIYYLAVGDEIYLLTIYSKKDDNRIPNNNQIMMMIKDILK